MGPAPVGPAQEGLGARVGETHPGVTNDRWLSDGVSQCLRAQKQILGCDLPHSSSRIFQDRQKDSHGCSDLSPPAGTPLWPSPGAGRARPVAFAIQAQTQLVAGKRGVHSRPLCPVASCDTGLLFSRVGRVVALPSPLRETAELCPRQQRARARASTSSPALAVARFAVAVRRGPSGGRLPL